MSPGAGAGAGVEPDFKFLLEPEPEWSRVKNLAGSATLDICVPSVKCQHYPQLEVFLTHSEQKIASS